MEQKEAETLVERLIEEWCAARKRADQATREASGLAKIIGGYVEMFPELKSKADVGYFDVDGTVHELLSGSFEDTPRGAEAVSVILQESPGNLLRVSELVSELRGRGWLPESDNPANAVRAALERLYNATDSDVYKERIGPTVFYTYDPDRAPPVYMGGDEEPF